MTVKLQFQSSGSIPGDGQPIRMQGASLTMGRSPENDVVLPDPDRVLSKRHCMIEDHNGNVVVVDISTNGTFLNYGKVPLGPTPTPLNDGDILSVGPYELLVSIAALDNSDVIADPLSDGPIGHGFADNAPSVDDFLDAPGDGGDFLDDLLGGRDAPAGPGAVDRAEPDEDGLLPPLGDEEDPLLPPAADPFSGGGASYGSGGPAGSDHFSIPQPAGQGAGVIPDDWDDDLLAPSSGPSVGGSVGSELDPFGAPSAPPSDFYESTNPNQGRTDPTNPGLASTAPPVVPPAEPTQPRAPTAPPANAPPSTLPRAPAAASASGTGDAAARAFLDAIGADDVPIPDADLVATMERMGKVTRLMIEGLREILMTRTQIKSEFRIEQTMISAGGNNPLKFSISSDQAIEAMVKPKARGYLGAEEAAAEALQDIRAHEVATISGMEAALKGLLHKLDPKELEGKLEKGTGIGSMLTNKKARYWEVYESKYAEIADQAENDFQELFAKEFARAYQDQLDKLK